MNRALQICYYPIRDVVAGGQIRVSELARLINNLGYERSFLGIYPYRNDGWPSDFPISRSAHDWVFRVPHDFEMRISDAVLADRSFLASILKTVDALNPSLIWFEHPFLWPIFSEWINRRRNQLKIIYSSHNVEWIMKKNLLEHLGISDDACIQRLYKTERDLVFNADAVLCCSDSDLAVYSEHGRPDAITIPNGSTCPIISNENNKKELAHFSKLISPTKRTLVFISSWHEPNWFGLRDLVLVHMKPGGLLQDVTLVLMGDICKLYESWCVSAGEEVSGVICAGRVTEKEKDAIFRLADIVLLPITAGGGTNLKTAEALLSKRIVVATNIAFRGFERHADREGVFCSVPERFNEVLAQALQFLNMTGSRSDVEKFCSQRLEFVKDCCWTEIIKQAHNKLAFLLEKKAE